MKPTLRPGLTHRLSFRVPASKTVPALFPESGEFRQLPPVLATGFLVGLLEWACMALLQPHLEPAEISLGTHVDASHAAPTPVGRVVEVQARLAEVRGRELHFVVSAHDGVDLVSRGTHRRHVVPREAFLRKVAAKAAVEPAGA